MKKSLTIALFLSSLSFAACSKGDGESTKIKHFSIDEISVSIDAPENWKLEKNMDRFYVTVHWDKKLDHFDHL